MKFLTLFHHSGDEGHVNNGTIVRQIMQRSLLMRERNNYGMLPANREYARVY